MLFVVSLISVLFSSYVVATLLTKKAYEHFTYLLLTLFAQIVLTFEVLSLFNAINETNVLIFNIIFAVIALILWIKSGKPLYILKPKDFMHKFKNALKLDKVLFFAFLAFCIMILSALILNIVAPVTNADSSDYHVARSVWYLIQGNLNHFSVADARAVIFPFNSEILYAWLIMFLKKELFLGFISFFGFLMCMTSIYKIMKLQGFSLRKTLWVIFLTSSFASVLVQVSSTETDILTGGLILASITLFWISLKEKQKPPIFMSALAYALALGIKTTAIMAIPAVGILFLYLCKRYKNYKNLLVFSGFTVLNFIIFSSYNYIVNLIDYGNIMGVTSAVVVHKNFYGIRGMIANFVRHIFLFFDFTGFKWAEYIGGYIVKGENIILQSLHVSSVPEGVYTNPSGKFGINGTLFEPNMGLGILGFLVYLPCLSITFIKQFFTKKRNEKFLGLLSNIFIVFLLVTSYTIVYMNFNVRFMTMFVVITSPILAISYFRKNNILKTFMTIFMIFYLTLVSTHLWPRPLWFMTKAAVYNNENIHDIRQRLSCSNFYKEKGVLLDKQCFFWYNLEKVLDLKSKNILYLTHSSTNIMIPGMLNYTKGANIDLEVISNYEKINFNKYDYIIMVEDLQYTTCIKKRPTELNYNEKTLNKNKGKLKFKRDAQYYCLYKMIDGKIYNGKSNTLKTYPIASECFIDKKTFKQNGFEYKGTISNTFNIYGKI